MVSITWLQITVHGLNDKNYLEWSQYVKLAIDGRGKFQNMEIREFLSGDMTSQFMFLPTTRDVWDSVCETYSTTREFLSDLRTKIEALTIQLRKSRGYCLL